MQINYWAVLVCAVIAMGIGYVWYGPLFGKKWMEVIGADERDMEARREMQKHMMPLMVVHFILTLFQVLILEYYVKGWTSMGGLVNALWIWAAFVMPTVAGSSMWNNDKSKVAWTRFLLQAGYQLVVLVIFGVILGAWQ